MARLPEWIDYGFCRIHIKDGGLSAKKSAKENEVMWTIETKIERRWIRLLLFKGAYRLHCFVSRICGVPLNFVSDLFNDRYLHEEMKKHGDRS